jgi:hypothetical protein
MILVAEIAGLLLLVLGVALMSIPIALIVLGIGVIVFALALDRTRMLALGGSE